MDNFLANNQAFTVRSETDLANILSHFDAEFVFDFTHHIICTMIECLVFYAGNIAVGVIQINHTTQVVIIIFITYEIYLKPNITAIIIAVNNLHNLKRTVLDRGVDIFLAHQFRAVFFNPNKVSFA